MNDKTLKVGNPLITIERKKKLIEQEIIEILERETYIDKREGNEFGYEIFVDYDEKFGQQTLADISKSDDPRAVLCEAESELIMNAEDCYYLIGKIEDNISDFNEYEEFIRNWVQEHVYWYLPEKVFNQSVKVNIALDTGDLNTDFTECNILNWYGMTSLEDGEVPEIPKDSPIYHLAKQQGKLEELEYALTCEVDQGTNIMSGEYSEFSSFTKSIIQELQNACSHMNTFVFLTEMSLMDYIKLREMIANEKPLNDSYYYEDRKGTKSIIIGKSAMCGLYDVWGGGGSVLEVELEKDVELPIKAIWDAWIEGSDANGRGYDINDVYGLIGSCWRDVVRFKEEAA